MLTRMGEPRSLANHTHESIRSRRAALVTHGPLSVVGGVERHCRYLLEFLKDEGFTVDVFGPHDAQAPRVVRRYLYPVVQYYYAAREVGRHRDDYDLIVTTSFTGGSVKGHNVINISYGSVLSYFRHIKHDVDYNWKWHLGMYLTIWLDKLSKQGKRCLAISDQVRQELERDYGVTSIVIPCGIDMKHFSKRPSRTEVRRRLGIGDQSIVGLYAGRWDVAHKGLDILIQVMRGRDDVHWLIAPDMDIEVGGIRQLSVLPRVGFSYDEIPEVYSAVDFSIQLSRYESFGFSFLESLACSVPAISTPVGVATEVYADPLLSPLLVPHRSDLDKMLLHVHRTIDSVKDGEYRDRLGTRGRAIVESQFSLDIWKERMRRVLHSDYEGFACK